MIPTHNTSGRRRRRPQLGARSVIRNSSDDVFRDLTPGISPSPNGDGPSVEIDSSPLYELLLTLLEFGYGRMSRDLQAPSEWYDRMRRCLSADVLSAYDELAPRCWLWHSLLFLARGIRVRRPSVHAVQFIEQLRSMDAQQLFEYLLGCGRHFSSVTSALLQEAVLGNSTARMKIARALFLDDPEEDRGLVRFLAMPPQRAKELLLRIINGWYIELFRNEERELAVQLGSEARAKRVIGGSAPSRLLRASAIGLHYLPRHTVKHILLVPSIICRPSIITIRFGRTRFFFYPLPDECADGAEIPAQLVKIHRALAEPQRLRILRALIITDKTVESLSRELDQSPQSLTAQLIILRDAGLVTLRMDERRMSFAIRQNLPSIVFRTLQAYLPEPIRFSGKA